MWKGYINKLFWPTENINFRKVTKIFIWIYDGNSKVTLLGLVDFGVNIPVPVQGNWQIGNVAAFRILKAALQEKIMDSHY
ncbi:hypothetical protein ABY64_17200 [Enterobacter hormaechei]|nr:hypothetical protein ECNIH2_19310 [Enterobacter cloacae ECNIH2]AKK78188.1 hypothetical protein ABY62_16720 [Enterobacter hormaechei]KTH84836.1 hypothetical protein ASV15_19590 [Enterobacter hormaechei subsp. steigerwaltii]AKK91230.1 hypothetical protein ABY65_07760 [Enterobacter hormaechei]AKK97620.1 hypothetical protein ABY64_17200 [Enterobacter hormaechei]